MTTLGRGTEGPEVEELQERLRELGFDAGGRDGDLFAFGRRFEGEVYDHGTPWRTHRFWAAYTREQTDSVSALVDHLCLVFNVPRRTPGDHLGFDRDLFDFAGVVGHHHLREDKTDLHPGFAWNDLVHRCQLQLA